MVFIQLIGERAEHTGISISTKVGAPLDKGGVGRVSRGNWVETNGGEDGGVGDGRGGCDGTVGDVVVDGCN